MITDATRRKPTKNMWFPVHRSVEDINLQLKAYAGTTAARLPRVMSRIPSTLAAHLLPTAAVAVLVKYVFLI